MSRAGSSTDAMVADDSSSNGSKKRATAGEIAKKVQEFQQLRDTEAKIRFSAVIHRASHTAK